MMNFMACELYFNKAAVKDKTVPMQKNTRQLSFLNP